MKEKMKFWIKVLIIPILLGILFLLFNNGFILERIRNKINSSSLLKIEHIDGNLFTHLDLREVKFGKVFNAPRVSIHYTPLSIIKRNIRYIEIQSPVIKVDNAEYISIVSPFSIKYFVLNNSVVLNIPQIRTINFSKIQGSLEKKGEEQILHIEKGEGNIELKDKILKIKEINGVLSLEQDFIKVKELLIGMFGGEISISGITNPDSLNFRVQGLGVRAQEIDGNLNGIATIDIGIAKYNDNLSVKGTIKLDNGKYKGYPIGKLRTDLVMLNKDLKLKIKEWKLKEMNFVGDIYVNLDSLPVSYNAVLTGRQINLAEFFKTLPSNLSGKVKIEGKGEEFQSIIDLSGSVQAKRLESINAHIMYSPSEIEILSLSVKNEAGKVSVQGNISPEKINLSLTGKGMELELFSPRFSGMSNFELLINGDIKDPGVSGTFYIKDFKSDKINSNYFSGNLNLERLLPPQGNGEITLADLDLYGNRFESFQGIFNTDLGQENYEIKAHSDSTDLEIKGDISENVLSIHTFSFISPAMQCSNNGDIKIKFQENQLNINFCELLVNNSPVQIEGLVSKNNLAFTMTGENLYLHKFSDVLKGRVSFTCSLNGSMQNPIISLVSEVNNFSYTGIEADKVFVALIYRDYVFHIERGEINKGKGSMEISGKFPVTFPFFASQYHSEQQRKISFDLDKPMDIRLVFSNFGKDISFPYRKFVDIKEGSINGKLLIKGKPKEPKLYGDLSFIGKSIDVQALNTSLKLPIGKVNFEGNKIHISSFSGKTPDGFVKLAGTLQIPEKLHLDVYAKNMKIRSIENIDATISTNLTLEGSFKTPKLKGNIEVEEALITMPFGKQTSATSVNLQHPMDYDLTVNFPNKIWIKNSMVDAELEGNVKLRKEKEDFVLAGNTKIKKGYFSYSFKGMFERQFKIDHGEFVFTNSPKLNPNIDLHASTIVRYTVADTIIDTSITRQDTIKLQVTGTMREPEFTLSSVPPMPIEDMITLLSLNMRAEDLSKLQNFQYAQTVGVKAVSSLLLRELVLDELKSQMGVDALRLEAELFGEERTARFNIGKYVLKDLYVSYSNDLFSPSRHNFKAEYSPWKYGSLVGETTEEGVRTGVQLKIRY